MCLEMLDAIQKLDNNWDSLLSNVAGPFEIRTPNHIELSFTLYFSL